MFEFEFEADAAGDEFEFEGRPEVPAKAAEPAADPDGEDWA